MLYEIESDDDSGEDNNNEDDGFAQIVDRIWSQNCIP
jgi:hypothetical protein